MFMAPLTLVAFLCEHEEHAGLHKALLKAQERFNQACASDFKVVHNKSRQYGKE